MAVSIKYASNTYPVSPLFIDKLAFTFDVPDEDRFTFEKVADNLGQPSGAKYYNKSRRVYIPGQHISADGQLLKAEIVIQYRPKYPCKKMKYARIELNPNQLGWENFVEIINTYLPFSYDYVHENASVTRIDVATDIQGVPRHALSFVVKGMQVTKYLSKSGITEYVGAEQSGKHYAMYDKQEEIKCKNKNIPQKYQKMVPSGPVTRFECRMKPSLPLKSLYELKNPFEKVTLIHMPEITSQDTDLFRLFKLCGDTIGYQPALCAIKNKKTKQQYLQILNEANPAWWDPDTLWSQFGDLLDSLQPNKSTDNPYDAAISF